MPRLIPSKLEYDQLPTTYAKKNWTLLTSTTGSTTKQVSLSGYDEVLLVAKQSDRRLMATVPIAEITSTEVRFLLGGGWVMQSYGTFATVKLTLTSVQLWQMYVDGADQKASTTLNVYVR